MNGRLPQTDIVHWKLQIYKNFGDGLRQTE